MKVSYQWLCDVVDIRDVPPSQLATRLTSAGLTVDGVTARVDGVSGVVVGLVVACEPHPNADRLQVCQVQTAVEAAAVTIVCGAPNVRAGQKVPVAKDGAVLPGGRIGRAKLRGVESNGMLCSAKEIGLEIKLLPREQTEGLYILPEDAPIGADIVSYLHLDDVILDLDLTPNRSDCLSIRGLAYEIGALYHRQIHLPEAVVPVVGQDSPVTVEISTTLCTRYDAQVLMGLTNQPAPLWMQMRLMSMGIRPINAIVDVTNYVMLELGQPLHAFDFDEVRGGTIVVRLASEAEEIVTLDGVTRTLPSESVVISDLERAIGIAGVMGAENSEIKRSTRRVILESAHFDAPSVRRTGQRLGLHSEAQQRFEKGIDEETIDAALRRATELYVSLCGATLVGDSVRVIRDAEDAQTMSRDSRRDVPTGQGMCIEFEPMRCRALLGAEIDEAQMRSVFERLGFSTEDNGAIWSVRVPTRRQDIQREADLVEEVARFIGYDTIPSTLPVGPTTAGVRTLNQQLQRITRNKLVANGIFEVFTYSFTHPNRLDALRLPADSEYRRMVPLALPMSDERTVLRTHLLPSLAQVAAYNLTRGSAGGSIFEIARVYRPDALPLVAQPKEVLQWAGLWFGDHEGSISQRPSAFDYYDAKGAVETWLESIGLMNRATYVRTNLPWYHPGRAAQVCIDDTVIGTIGQLHPETAASLGLQNGVYAEFDLAVTEHLLPPDLRTRALPRFPASLRDLAVVVASDVAVADVVALASRAVDKVAPGVLESCKLFDVYQGEGIAPGYQSLAFAFVYRAPDKTLTEDEIGAMEQAVLQAWGDAFGAELRH